ncbi:MAG TPA: DUF1569 domain-containing protein [Planctomycetes bacterium]|nr:DUF1569 domain-containing protein [Fuerstiella sp.]HIK91656.1 DUF1569 domain-containing protein [Planctomycetota bacterium]
MINTKKVTGRREIRYESIDDYVADAERLAGPNVHTLGNWSPGQIHEHLATTMNSSIDGFSSMLPAPVRWLLTLLMKRKFLTKGLPAGFKAPSNFVPAATSVEDGLAAMRAAVARQKEESSRAQHPGFGRLTHDEWNDFHLRHAELHMSFLDDSD